MTSVFITFNGDTDPLMHDALCRNGMDVIVGDVPNGTTHYVGELLDTADDVDAWFANLPWNDDDTTALVAIDAGVMVTSVVIDGELVSTTRADVDGVEVVTFDEVPA